MKKEINFIGKNSTFGTLSVVLVVLSILSITFKGLNYGIDFAGGVEMQVRFASEVKSEDIRDVLTTLGVESSQVQQLGTNSEYLIRFENQEEEELLNVQNKEAGQFGGKASELRAAILDKFSTSNPEVLRVDSVGPRIGAQLKRNGTLAIFYSLILILIYVGLRFDYNFAPGAAICLFHDSVITLGIFSFLDKEINVQILASLLTIIGYSLNDTIVIFDRIRENISLYKNNKLPWIINRSINDVLSRTLLTSITTLIAVVSLYLIAGGVISDFAFALGIGVIVGTYSSVYIASPLVIQFAKLKKK